VIPKTPYQTGDSLITLRQSLVLNAPGTSPWTYAFQLNTINGFLGFTELEAIYTKYRIELVELEFMPNACFRNLLAQGIPNTDPVCLLLGDLWGAMVHGVIASTVSLSDVATSKTAQPVEFDRRRKWI
jgi:hypothetical protein